MAPALDAGRTTRGANIDPDTGPRTLDDSTTSPISPVRQASDVHRQLLSELAGAVFLPTYQDFHVATVAFQSAAEAFAQSLSDADLSTVRAAWGDAMAVWQRAEVLQVGPAGSMTTVLGGEDRRSEIYSWSTVNPCRVCQELTEDAHTNVDGFASELVNVRGLDALEYLLFSELETNECKAASSINKDGTWQALVDEGALPARRAAYTHTLSVLLEREARYLVDRWEAAGNGFLIQLATAGISSEVYATAQEALNGVSDAMFYVEKQTKDMKLAVPAGISGCDEDTCPEELESRWAHHSKENIFANVHAFQLLFLGGEPETDASGFDDLLVGVGQEALATEMTDTLAAAITAIQAIEGTLADAVVSNPQSVQAAYEALTTAMALFKTEFMASLDLEVPNRAAADND